MPKLPKAKDPWNVALKFLTFRPRSQDEVRKRLVKDFTIHQVECVITQLIEKGFINDREFCHLWINYRNRHRPSSKRMILSELLSKGINKSLAEELIDNLDDESNAMKASLKVYGRYYKYGYTTFRTKLGNYLIRKGFTYGVSSKVVNTLCQNLSDSVDSDIRSQP